MRGQFVYLGIIILLTLFCAQSALAQTELGDDVIDEETKDDADKMIDEADKELVEETPIQTAPSESEILSFDEMWMLAPMRTGHKNGIYSLAGYGRMEAARTLDIGGIQAGLNYILAGFGGAIDDDPNFDGTLSMFELEGRYGIIENLEAGLRLMFGGWDGTLEVYNLPLNTEAATAIGDVFLHGKYRFLGEGAIVELNNMPFDFDVAGLLTLKFPTGSQNDALSTGAFDFSLNVLGSAYPIEKLGVNVMLGITYASDGDKVQPEENRTWGMLMNFGIGGAYQVHEMVSALLQIEFYDPAMDITVGAKGFFEVEGLKVVPELGLTFGLYKQAADITLLFSVTVFLQ
ncbi:MAG: DUF3187 family protein [Planctomycetes bacterium]|nr:DUF3187 family protein [Planctomycetota bacterium]